MGIKEVLLNFMFITLGFFICAYNCLGISIFQIMTSIIPLCPTL